MSIKKVMLLLIFIIAIISVIAPVNAKLEPILELESMKTVNGKTKLYITVNSDVGNKNTKNFYSSANYVSKRKKELNNVNKITISIKGYKTVNIKRPVKGWKTDKSGLFFDKTFLVKGKSTKIDNKSYSIKIYNKKNKLIRNKKGKVLSEWYFSENEIRKNPKKYFNKLQSKNKKNYVFFNSNPSKKIDYLNSPTVNMIATSSDVAYYYNKDSNFKKEVITENIYYSNMYYMVKKAEKQKNYTNGEYTVYISSYKYLGKWFKHVELVRKVNKTSYGSIKNPYFTISKECNWTNPRIISLANSIKANVSKINYTNDDEYKMELANAVIRYLHLNIQYDYNFSTDQTAVTTLIRGSGTCYGKSMLAGALLRALGIPTYFESQWTNRSGTIEGHTWPMAYIFYKSGYQWIPSETTTYLGDNITYYETYYLTQQEYLYPFYFGATDWWIRQGNTYLTIKGYSNYYQ